MTAPLPPGWYPDPSGAPGQRYWDGYAWHNAIPARPGPVAPKTPTNWKALGIMAGALVALIMVASIIGGLTGGGENDKNTSATTTQQHRTDEELAFLVALNLSKDAPQFDVDDEDAVRLGHTVCLYLDQPDASIPSAIFGLKDYRPEFSSEQAAFFVGTAVAQLCPEHKP
jgi:hypothetical protein